jgi:hypothetical protein
MPRDLQTPENQIAIVTPFAYFSFQQSYITCRQRLAGTEKCQETVASEEPFKLCMVNATLNKKLRKATETDCMNFIT